MVISLLKVLNLYAGIGGNRKLWKNVEVTAIESNYDIAQLYKNLFPDDMVLCEDAHQYLLGHYEEFDFIWSSPPCPTHSRINTDGQRPMRYPDMTLYQEIIALGNNWFKGKWVVENVIPYYKPLVPPTVELSRHYIWSNFYIPKRDFISGGSIQNQNARERFGFNLEGNRISGKRQILRNLVDPEMGLYILNKALDIPQEMQGRLELQ